MDIAFFIAVLLIVVVPLLILGWEVSQPHQ